MAIVKRGKGCRRKVQENTIAPTNWHAFLRIDQNKTELFRFISHELQGYNDDNVTVLYAYDDVCQSNNPQMDVTFVSPSNHEEADTRVFLHAKDMAHHGHTKIAIRTVDTDVLVLAISAFSHLEDIVEEFGWILAPVKIEVSSQFTKYIMI